MKFKRIANLVFYKYYNEEGKEERRACIFYNDGTTKHVTYDEGIDACQEIVKEYHITSRDAFKELINNNIIHVTSGSELYKNFSNYVVNEINMDNFENTENLLDEDAEEEIDIDDSLDDSEADEEIEDELEDEDFFEEEDFADDIDNDEEIEENEEIEADDSLDEDIEDLEDIEEDLEEQPKERKGILGFFQRGWEKIRKNKLVGRISLCFGALLVFVAGYTCGARKTKEGQIFNSNFVQESQLSDNKDTSKSEKVTFKAGDNSLYNNYTFSQLQEVTYNQPQKKSMKALQKTISNFNGSFANAYLEEGKDVRAALTFDEMVAIQQAYNDYSKDEIKAYFNGAEINASNMDKDYKSATLQLMGAHVIENREHPVDMSKMLNDEKAKEFYAKFHEMFLQAKEATGEDKIAKVNAFRQEIRKEFPITKDVRTEGIMHADAYDSIKSYKLSVVPMIAASEMMFQNLETDNTLNDSEIDFLNDIGLCNYAQDKFEKIETITLSSEADKTNPLYEQYRNSIINSLKKKNQYVTDDAHRDLSKLDAFQNQVNWHFETDESGYFTGEVYYTVETRTETKTWTTKQTNYREEIAAVEKEIPASERAKIDKKIAKENDEAKAKGEKEAEKTKDKMQKEADKDAEKVKKEVKEDEKDLQDKIDDANDKIDENNKDEDTSNDEKVNEKDFGDHDVDFDDEHSDDQGNLNNSVENITTDGTGDQTNEELPDSNKTGEKFDKEQSSSSNSSSTSSGGTSSGGSSSESKESNKQSSGGSSSESKESNKQSSSQNISEYEEAVNNYVEEMANSSEEQSDSYEYTK